MLRRPGSSLLLLALLCFPLCHADAQLKSGNLHVYVTYPDDRVPNGQMKVALIGDGNQVAETYTNDHGQADFMNVVIGNYQVSVTGDGIEATTSEMFEVDSRRGAQSIFVRVRPTSDDAAGHADKASGNTVATGDLKVPKKASQEFDKASKAIANQQWEKAIEQLNKALAIYPGYAQAYNNLGVVYARLGDPVKERDALQKAVTANDHFAPAWVNLARLEMKGRNYPAAETDLKQATIADPTDVRSLALLAQTQLLESHYEDAIASARRVHAMSHEAYAQVHYVAARALERLNRLADAITELKLFLSEEPSGALSATARKEIAVIERQ